MVVSDQLGDMLIRLKNAAAVAGSEVEVPYSQFKLAVSEKLRALGFLSAVEIKGRKTKKNLALTLAFVGKKPRLQGLQRISKPSCRVYHSYVKIKPSSGETAVYSTPQGILSGQEARKVKAGGEFLFKIW